MNSLPHSLRAGRLVLLCLCSTVLFLAACGGSATPTPSSPRPPRSTVTPVATSQATVTATALPSPSPSPTPEGYFVSILNRRLNRAELIDALGAEGTLTVAGWNYAARDSLVRAFEAWVKDEYGVDVALNYVSNASPAQIVQSVYTANKSGAPAPYDVVAIEENYLANAILNDAAEEILGSELLNSARDIETAPLLAPYGVPFQSTATVAPIFHNASVGEWLRDWKSLSDPRLNQRLTLPTPGSTAATLFLVAMANALGTDYATADGMNETITFVCEQIHPNVLLYTDDFSEMQELLRENRIDAAVAWNVLARLEGLSGADGTSDITYRPMAPGQPALNGYAWIPKHAEHPVLAQVFIQWRLTNDAQLPGDAWDLNPVAWGEYHEGLLNEAAQEAIPARIVERYAQFYPTPAEISESYFRVNWDAVSTRQADWMTRYAACAQ